MTIDEAIKHAEEVAEQNETQAEKWQEEGGEKWGKTTVCRERAKEHRQLAEWLKDYKRLLEQEPCEDTVSREAVLAKKDLIELPDGQSFYCIAPDDVEKLPSVTPTRKHGEWEEEVFDLGANLPVRVAYQCSECGNYFDSEFNYCPHCGADMRGGKE